MALTKAVAASGLSKAKIARQMDSDVKQLNRYLTAESATPLTFLEPFAKITGTSVEAILREADFLPRVVDYQAFINSDPRLTPAWKELLKASYETALTQSAS